MAGERESSFSGEREGVQGREREEFKRTEHSRARGEVKRELREVCPGYLTSAFLTPPNGCLDQLGPMLERLLLCCSTQSIN